MKTSATDRVKGFFAPRLAVKLLLVSLGLTAGAFAQYPDNPESADLWREWMSVLQREPSQISGPRLYLMTDREVLQTSPSTASFQSGGYRMVLADGSVPDVDGDADGYTDRFEDGNIYANRNDPTAIPRAGNPPAPLPTDASSPPVGPNPILIANGNILGVADSTLNVNTQASIVKPSSGSNVRVSAAPSSKFVRPVGFSDFSSQFYYYYVVPGQTIGEYRQYPLSLYHLSKDFPNPGDGNTLETTIVPGLYRVEFPTIFNPPTGKASIDVGHRLVPNGSLTVGLKKPTWLIRSLKSIEKPNALPVEQKWVNGRLKFDPYLPLTLQWDNLVTAGLASTADYIELTVEDELLGRITYTFRVNAGRFSLDLSLSNSMYGIYGTIRETLEEKTFPLNIEGNIVMKYFRYANRQTNADLSSVTVRIPIEMYISYASWRQELFANDANNDSVSGPNADPDGDGLTNQQEFDAGSDPRVDTIGVSDPTSAEITFNSATLGGTVNVDPTSTNVITERGVVYSPTDTNNNPLIDGAGVNKAVWILNDPGPGPAPIPLDDTDDDGLSDRWERLYFKNLNQTGAGDPDGDTQSNEMEETALTNPTIGTFTIDVTDLSPATGYSFKAYAISDVGTTYSTVATFTTLGTPLTDPTFTNVTLNSATLGATVSGTGFTLFERGVVYSATATNPFPTVDGPGVNRAVSLPAVIGTYTVPVVALDSGTQYSFCGYVITNLGTFYTSPVSTFTTLPAPPVTPPIVTTLTSSGITAASAILGGNVTSDGNSAITGRGVVYSLTSENDNPFLGDPGVLQVTGTGTTGVFTVNVTGLLPETTYSFRAYAINAVGISHTSDFGTFTTLPAATAPLISSPTAADIASSSATLGGDVTGTGGSPVLQRGVVFSLTATNPNPLMGGAGVTAFAASTTGTGVFTANATNLSPGKSYSFKAYAINAVGTSYTTVGTFTTAATLATVTTLTLSNVTSSSANLGANVTSDGGSVILERGFIYSLASVNGNPLIGGSNVIKVIATGTTGVMSANISGLLADTGYVFKGYAINAVGNGYSAANAFTTPQIIVSNPTATSITINSAVLGGTVSGPTVASIIERGVVYSLFGVNPSPEIDGAGVTRVKNATNALGAFTVSVPGLLSNTRYSYSAYMITTAGTFYSSPASTFTTLSQAPLTLPAVTSPTIGAITSTSAVLGGNVTTDGGSVITERGVVYSVSGVNDNPFIGGAGVTKVAGTGTTGVFTVNAPGLLANTTYSFRAYAVNSVGTSYTSTIGTFTSATSPTVTSLTVASITINSAVLGGNLTHNGNSPIIERGVVYSLTSANNNPQIGGVGVTKQVVPGTILGVFSATVTGLQAGSSYSFRAYSTNAVGTGYTTAVGTFTTATAPIISSPTSANITASSATLGGNITSDGGAAVVQRGVVFSLTTTNANPSIGGVGVSAVADSTTGIGVFTVDISGLAPGGGYSFKAYAINGGTPSYTAVASFASTGALARITTPTLSSITSNSATFGANVTSDGAAAITQRGFIYSQTSINGNPVVGGPGVTQLIVAGTTGVMSGNISGLLADTGYTFKAFAVNSAGTAYAAPYAFFTTFPPLTVSSPTFADVTVTTATLGGTVVSDGGTTVSGRGVVLTLDPNVAPVLGGAGVITVVGPGTMGAFTVPVIGLSPDSDYYFRAYATNGVGTSYSNVSSFKTLPALLLGQAQMQWIPAEQPALVRSLSEPDSSQSQSAAIEAPVQSVPEFAYLKAASESVDPMIYHIEVSLDNREWLAIDENEWTVTSTPTEIKATWASTTSSPPTRIFFRIGGRLGK